MKSISNISLLILMLLTLSCTNNEETRLPPATTCKLEKYNPYVTETNTVYGTELIYNNAKVAKRLTYGNIASASTGYSFMWGLLSRDSIVYDAANRVSKIFYRLNHPENSIKENDTFFYTGSSIYPYKRERDRISQEGYVDKWQENITYDMQNKIQKTTAFYSEFPEETILNTEYFYSANGNLNQKIEEENYSGNIRKTTTIYSNYDTQKNPFQNINVPFIENREVQFSKNNYRKYESTVLLNGVLDSYNNWEISAYQYNEFGYPLFGIYLCQ